MSIERVKPARTLVGCAMREALAEGITKRVFWRDCLAGIVAGFVAAAVGGSRAQVTGPTAAFVVILAPVVAADGPGGLLLATLIAGVFILLMGVFRLGKLVEFIPCSATAGFTLGIAVTIALLQVKDLFGIEFTATPESTIERVCEMAQNWRSFGKGDAVVGLVSPAALVAWGKLRAARRIPGAIVIHPCAVALAMWLSGQGPDWTPATIDSRFGHTVDGVVHGGIPSGLPRFQLPESGVAHISAIDPSEPSRVS